MPEHAPSELESMVDAALSRGARRLVLPAEVSAAEWRRLLARSRGALWAQDVLSWDRFKEESVASYQDQRPANRLMRRVFAEEFLRRNREKPFLERMVAPDFAEFSGRYAGALTTLLPALDGLLSASGTAAAENGEALLRDLRRLYRGYREFLRTHGLFEPQWRRRELRAPGQATALLACNLATDYREFAGVLEHTPGLTLLPLPERFPEHTSLRRYPTLAAELQDLFLRLEGHLDAGIAPDEIAVTVGNLPALRDRMLLEARRRDVPVVFRQGRPLSEYSGVALFRLLSDAVAGGFRYEALRDLLLHRAIPWQNRGALRQALLAAGRSGRLWFTPRSEGAPLPRLAWDIRGVVAASGFADLRDRLYAFFGSYLDTAAFPAREERAFQSAMDVLADLVAEEERGLPSLHDPFSFFVTLLSERQYVPRDGETGIPIYPFRVSAAICPEYHYVVNASQSATKVSSAGALQLIPESFHERLGLDPYDVSDAMLKAYAYSGRQVFFSVSERGEKGTQLAAGAFAAAGIAGEAAARGDADPAVGETATGRGDAAGARGDATAGRGDAAGARGDAAGARGDAATARAAAPDTAAAAAEDPYEAERRYLAGDADHPPDRAYRPQVAGLRRILGTLERPAWMDRRSSAFPAVLPAAASIADMTVTAFERYWNCPFGYLMEVVYGAREGEIAPDTGDPRRIGTLYHRVLQELYDQLRREDGVLQPDHLGDYRERGREVARRALAEAPAVLRQTAEPSFLLLLDQITAWVLQTDLETYPRYEIFALEEEFCHTLQLEEGALRLRGTLDRVFRNPETGAVVIIDYKRRAIPEKRRLRGELGAVPATQPGGIDADTELSLQMPAYVYLLEQNGHPVEAAVYYSLEEAKRSHVYGPAAVKPYLNREELDLVLSRIDERLRALPGRARAGDYRVPAETQGCASCRLRGVCRTRFAVES